MREYAKILPQFWIGNTGKKIKSLGLESQVVSFYLMTCPHASMSGVYYLPITFISHETGISFEGASKALQSLCEIGFCSYDEQMEYVWVREMAFYQVGGQLKPGDNRIKGMNEIYKNLPQLSFLSRFFEKYRELFFLEIRPNSTSPLVAPLKGLRSKEQEQEQEKEKEKIYMSSKPEELYKNQQKRILKIQAEEILQFLNKKTGRVYRPVESNLKLIIARLSSGATTDDCRQVIAKKTREWKDNPKMAEYLRPATLFNATKFEQYMGELVLPEGEEADE